MLFTRIKRLVLGQPLTNVHLHHEKIPNWKALSTLSSDALSSVAYATEAIFFVLLAASTAAVTWALPISLAIVALLAIITLSYRQTIEAYPQGGGAYIVAKENIGTYSGLVAGAALLIDYVLTVAVSVSAGVENIASAFPFFLEHRVLTAFIVIALIMTMNLRGIKDSATAFALPTYFFIVTIFILIGAGLYRYFIEGVIPQQAPLTQLSLAPVAPILILRAFASGCSALTGVEAISDGVPLFRDPASKNARTTLTWMAVILGSMFLGITLIAHLMGVVLHEKETLISVLGKTIFGEGLMYYALQVATALILFLAANTAYADFPRLSSILAKDRYLPRQLASLGDRLVFSNGIMGLSLAAGFLIYVFNGETLHLIPLYAVGVFLSFTLSQSGMVARHFKLRRPGWVQGAFINALGAFVTSIVLIDLTFTKFMHGAWMVVIMIPMLVLVFTRIHRHYVQVGKELTIIGERPEGGLKPIKHTVIIPISGIHRGVLTALRYALTISDDVRACYVELDSEATKRFKDEWEKWAPNIPLVVLSSPYRSVIQPLIKYIDDVEQITHDDMVTVVVPEFVTAKYWHQLLHNQTALFIKAALTFKKNKVVTSVRYHLKET